MIYLKFSLVCSIKGNKHYSLSNNNQFTKPVHFTLYTDFACNLGRILNTNIHIQKHTHTGEYIYIYSQEYVSTDGQQAHEKIFTITNYQRNTNQNCEISLDTGQNGHD